MRARTTVERFFALLAYSAAKREIDATPVPSRRTRVDRTGRAPARRSATPRSATKARFEYWADRLGRGDS